MAYQERANQRRSQAFVNAAYLTSGEEHPGQGPSYRYPLYERSQGFELGTMEEQDPQMVYSWVADPHFTQNPWSAIQESVDNSGDCRPPMSAQDSLPPWSHQADQASTAITTVQCNTDAVSTPEPSSSSSTKSTACDSSGSSSSGRHSDGSFGSDEAAQRPCGQSHATPSRKPKERQMSWVTCVSVVLMAVMVTSVLLLSLSVMVRMNRMMAAAPAGQLQGGTREAVSAAPPSTSRVLRQHTKRPYERRTSGLTATNGSSAPTWSAIPPSGSPTSTATTTYRELRTGSQSRRLIRPRALPPLPSHAPAADNENAEAEESSEDHMAFPFQHPTRPMCGDVFYTVCQSSQLEFHYRRSTNACVETATDAVHSCNRGTNRFASLQHCAQSCLGAHRPTDQCFGMPLFTSCARQDVLSSWWFFQGSKCVPWSFPSGGCPSNGSDVFRTAQECRRRCAGAVRGPPCSLPRAVACDRRHLKYPFFADLSMKDGHLRCRRSSPEVLSNRLCLIGANRFRSLEACMVTCKSRPRA